MIVQNKAATKSGIMEAIKVHLIGKVKRGGTAVFYFSGHGQQVKDNNGDELDGLDESIVPYDAAMRFEPGKYEGDLHFRDDELGEPMTALRKKLGKNGHLLLILDSCHSGTGTRGLSTARGTDVIMADQGYIASRADTLPVDNNALVNETRDKKQLATMVSFFGASANQLNYETISAKGEEVGSLTYAFSQVFEQATKEWTYQNIFERIKIHMTAMVPGQTPQVEGVLCQALVY